MDDHERPTAVLSLQQESRIRWALTQKPSAACILAATNALHSLRRGNTKSAAHPGHEAERERVQALAPTLVATPPLYGAQRFDVMTRMPVLQIRTCNNTHTFTVQVFRQDYTIS